MRDERVTDALRASSLPWRVLDDARPVAASQTRADVAVDASIVDAFQRDGVALVPGAYAAWVDQLRSGLERNLAAPTDYAFPSDSTTDAEPGSFFNSYCNWQRIDEYRDFVLRSSAAALAATCMRSATAQLFHEHSFVKEVGTAKATPWHHDLPYYCVDGTQTASIYIALDDIPEEASVRFLAGSHRSATLHLPRLFRDGSHYVGDPDMTPVPEIDDTDPRIVVHALAPGDALVFDFRTLHGSGDAELRARRRSFSTRWLGDDAHFVERHGVTSPPITGHDMTSGDRLRTDWFPVLWPNELASS